jgi:hypothetical protein
MENQLKYLFEKKEENEENEKNFNFYLKSAEEYEKTDEIGKILENLEYALECEPDCSIVMFLIGKLYYFRTNNLELGRKYLMSALENDLETIMIECGHVEKCEIYGEFYEKENNITEAIKYYSLGAAFNSDKSKEKVRLLCDYDLLQKYYELKYSETNRNKRENSELSHMALYNLSQQMNYELDLSKKLKIDFKRFPDSEYIDILEISACNGRFLNEIYDLIYNKLWEKYMINGNSIQYDTFPHNIIKIQLEEIKDILINISNYEKNFCAETSKEGFFAVDSKYMDYLGLFPLLNDNEKYMNKIMMLYGNSKSYGIMYSFMKLNPHKEFYLFINALYYWEKNLNIMFDYAENEMTTILEHYYDKGFDYNVNKDFLNFFSIDATRDYSTNSRYIATQEEKVFLLCCLGHINYEKKRYDYAIKYYTLACCFGNKKNEYLNNIGVIFCEKQNYKYASDYFWKCQDKSIQNLCKLLDIINDQNSIDYLKSKGKYIEYKGDFVFY